MKTLKSKLFILTAVTLLTALLLCNAFMTGSAPMEEAKAAAPLYTAEEVKTALLAYEQTGHVGALLKDITLPASKGVQTPKLDASRILDPTPLSQFGNKEMYYKELRAHGITPQDAENMTYSDYQKLRSGWKVDPLAAKALKDRYPQLAEADVSQWTYGTYDYYLQEQQAEDNKRLFAPQELEAMERLGLTTEDACYLLKSHGSTAFLILPQEQLTAQLEARYQKELNLLLGADWRVSAIRS